MMRKSERGRPVVVMMSSIAAVGWAMSGQRLADWGRPGRMSAAVFVHPREVRAWIS